MADKKPTSRDSLIAIQKDVEFLALRVGAIEGKMNWFIGLIVAGFLAAVIRLIWR